MRTVAEKMGIKSAMRAILCNAPDDINNDLKLPDLTLETRLSGVFDYVHLFAIDNRKLDSIFPDIRNHVAATGMFFVSWPKAGQLGTDLNLKRVIAIGYAHGMVESTTLSINAVWSAIKFTHPKPGKAYKNSYGKLPG